MIKGYKAFNEYLKCRGFQYKVGKTYEMNDKPIICRTGFHFCTELNDVFSYYNLSSGVRVCEVIAHGDIDEPSYVCDSKKCTNKIEIVRELSRDELSKLTNTGADNTGLSNSGYRNSGDYNSGNYNSGDYNSGNYNSGNYNSGYRNSGDYNSGNYNSGDYNSGDYNSGDYNSGDYNSGYRNSGDWNKTDRSSGVFNTIEPKIDLFNKPSNWTYSDWYRSDARQIMINYPKNTEVWIWWSDMSEEERKLHPEAEKTEGYLRFVKASETAQQWWDKLSESEKDQVLALPNFDPDVFMEITAIDTTADLQRRKDGETKLL